MSTAKRGMPGAFHRIACSSGLRKMSSAVLGSTIGHGSTGTSCAGSVTCATTRSMRQRLKGMWKRRNARPALTVCFVSQPGAEILLISLRGSFDLMPCISLMPIPSCRQFLCLAALCCLIDFFWEHEATVFVKGTLRIRYAGAKGVMLLDPASVHNLELLHGMRTGNPKVCKPYGPPS